MADTDHVHPTREHWYLLGEDRYLEFLTRAQNGEDIDLLMAETWAQSHSCPEDLAGDECPDAHLHTGISAFTFSLTPDESDGE